MNRTILLLLALTIAAPAAGATVRVRKQPTTNSSEPRRALLAVLNVERQSKAYYEAVLKKHRPFHPFGMVYRVEQRHEQVLVDELKQHAVSVPQDQSRPDAVAVPEERSAALAKAVELEKKTVAAYDKAIQRARSGDLRQTLEQLRSESADHQKWFADPDTCPMGGRARGGMGRRGA